MAYCRPKHVVVLNKIYFCSDLYQLCILSYIPRRLFINIYVFLYIWGVHSNSTMLSAVAHMVINTQIARHTRRSNERMLCDHLCCTMQVQYSSWEANHRFSKESIFACT